MVGKDVAFLKPSASRGVERASLKLFAMRKIFVEVRKLLPQ